MLTEQQQAEIMRSVHSYAKAVAARERLRQVTAVNKPTPDMRRTLERVSDLLKEAG